MINSLTFLNASWVWPVIVAGLVLILVFLWKEWTTTGMKNLLVKSLLMLLAISSLTLLALKPALPKPIKVESVVVLTENYYQDHLDSLKRAYRKLKVIDYSTDKNLEEFKNSKDVFVLGNGIAEFDLWQFEDLKVNYFPGQDVSGITRLVYEQDKRVGKLLSIAGKYQHPKFKHQLVLEDAAGTALDSVTLSNDTLQRFNLETDLKTAGNFVFYLSEKDSLGSVLKRNPLPLKVAEKQKMRVLMLSSYPTFEIKYLKNFLAELEHEVAVRNQITQNRFKFEFFNTEKFNLDRLNSSNLDKFDLVVLDGSSIKRLSNAEKSALLLAIRDSGLGLFILDEVSVVNSLGSFSVFSTQAIAETEVKLNQIEGAKLYKQPYQLVKAFGLEELHSSGASIVTAYKRLGQGRVGTTVLENTWQLQLEGKQKSYQEIWTKVVDEVSKRHLKTASWQADHLEAVVDEPFSFKLKTALESPEVKDLEEKRIPLKQDFNISELWHGTTYPKAQGWHKLKIQQDSSLAFQYYVHASEDWQALRSYKTQQANSSFFQKANESSEEVVEEPVAIHPLWFFGVFLFGMAGLWLEPKL